MITVRDAPSYEEHEYEDDRRWRHRPICACCGERIRSDAAYDVDGLYCQECFDIYTDNIKTYLD